MQQSFKVCSKCSKQIPATAVRCWHCASDQPGGMQHLPSVPPIPMPLSMPINSSIDSRPRLHPLMLAALILGIICASMYIINTLQGWYMEARAAQFIQEQKARIAAQDADNQQRQAQLRRNEASGWREMNQMDVAPGPDVQVPPRPAAAEYPADTYPVYPNGQNAGTSNQPRVFGNGFRPPSSQFDRGSFGQQPVRQMPSSGGTGGF